LSVQKSAQQRTFAYTDHYKFSGQVHLPEGLSLWLVHWHGILYHCICVIQSLTGNFWTTFKEVFVCTRALQAAQ